MKSASGIKRVWRAAGYSLDGFIAAFQREHAFRQELAVVVPLLLLAVGLPIPWRDTALLCASLLLVLIVELLNSAIETCVDYISLARHPLAKQAKDMGSLAVLLSLFVAGIIWLSVLF
ncbi:MAG: diacylglycerol kinase [Puniceicoccales bacterium]|jgi:diacylglycerol kinase (ATP)|nr:diacylglycerol kinase [Puniceicoccales bacterium]